MLTNLYVLCFIIDLSVLLFLVAYGKTININIVLLSVVVAISNGGYYALSMATTIEEAILANIICYVLGLFSPILIFFIICSVCRINVPKLLTVVLLGIQTIIFFAVCTTGKSTIFYKSIELNLGETGTYLTKTYGPMHNAYLISLLAYTVGGIIIAIYSLTKNTVVSRINVDIILFADVLTIGVYLVERLIHLNFELLPIFATGTLVIMTSVVLKVYFFSVYNNYAMYEDEIKKHGYILFNRNLKYMGCNDCAMQLFPELATWELERKIPGNGGRFNTFLRRPLMNYVQEVGVEKSLSKTYEYKGEIYRYEIGTLLRTRKWVKGYYIQVSNVTDVVKDNAV